ncbi:MAG: UbiX family flavin prenyltransferase [Phycisphaeraceae bacterium]|nr:UbiX family flavin prenyltransferase [Phycisphaeraceae bacterium]
MPPRIVVGISGASGALYAQRLLCLLLEADVDVQLVVSPLGQRVLHDELGIEGLDLSALTKRSPGADGRITNLTLHPYRDVGASIASGSFLHDGMVIIPCSVNSLAAVAHGRADNLLHRAAAVALKERRRLILVHRETPLSLVEIRNMQQVTEAGAIVCPANPSFYTLPRSIEQVVDTVVARVLDLLGVPHSLSVRWGENPLEAPSHEDA